MNHTDADVAVKADAILRKGIDALSAADKYAMLAFLASPAGAKTIAGLKDELVVVTRRAYPDERYPDTAARLGISPVAVNAAIARHNARTGRTDA